MLNFKLIEMLLTELKLEIQKKPRIIIPIAETFVIVLNSSFVGFFNVSQTLLHFTKNDFVDSNAFAIGYIEIKSF
jgi:hypothetical protein